MLSKEQVKEIFAAHMPDDVIVRIVSRTEHVETLRNHPYIREQVDLGIYDDDTLDQDLLSAVSSYVLFRRLDVCYELIADYMQDVPDDVSLGYLLAVAIHEGYHFAAGPTYTHEAHKAQEQEANDHVRATAPDLWAHHQRFEELSPVFKRVYARMKRRGLLA